MHRKARMELEIGMSIMDILSSGVFVGYYDSCIMVIMDVMMILMSMPSATLRCKSPPGRCQSCLDVP